MKLNHILSWKYYFIFSFFFFSCQREVVTPEQVAYRQQKTITYNDKNLDVIIDKPALYEVDVLILFHGTVQLDANIIQAANTTLDNFKTVLDRDDMMIVSVAYPGENFLLGDNLSYAEAALLWVKEKADKELQIKVKNIFLAGHSQGGYLVTMLNTLHETNGVVANAPGPLNLVYRCGLEESGQIASGTACTKIRNANGTTTDNPEAYIQRSLLSFTGGYKADIMFVQGLEDTPIQMYSWPIFRQKVQNCTDCRSRTFVEVPGGEHGALFTSPDAKTAFNEFIQNR